MASVNAARLLPATEMRTSDSGRAGGVAVTVPVIAPVA